MLNCNIQNRKSPPICMFKLRYMEISQLATTDKAGFCPVVLIVVVFSENMHRNHRASLSIGQGVMVVLFDVVAEMQRHGFHLVVLQIWN